MLVLRRKEGQWIEIEHHSGDRLRLRIYNIRANHPGQLDVAFEDVDRHFLIQRGECRRRVVPEAAGTPAVESGTDRSV